MDRLAEASLQLGVSEARSLMTSHRLTEISAMMWHGTEGTLPAGEMVLHLYRDSGILL